MIQRLKRLGRKGQGMTEYILVVVLVAVLAIGVIGLFGDQIRDLFTTSTAQLGGDDSATQGQHADPGQVQRGLDDISQ